MTVRVLLPALLAAALLALPSAACAFWYVCMAKDGHTHNGDEPPPECKDVPIREMNADGTLHRVIEPPETREQRAKREAEEAKRRQLEKQTEKQRAHDRWLLDHYQGKEDLVEPDRDRALAEPGRRITHAKQRLKELAEERQRLDERERPFYEKQGMPDWLKRRYMDNEEATAAQREAIDDANADIVKINQRFDADRDRLRLLINGATR